MFDDLKKNLCESLIDKENKPRGYLGCSLMGHPCDRLLWYQYKGIVAPAPRVDTPEDINKLSKKLLRFKLGHLIEDLLITLLDTKEEDGFYIFNKQAEISLLDGKLKGHIDGLIRHKDSIAPWAVDVHVLEIKSMNDQRFKLLQKKKVKQGFPEYWSQCQLYMKGMGFDQALLFAINKNTCEIYHEVIPYNEKDVEGLLLKAQRIFEYDSEPSIFTQPGRKIPLVCAGCDYFDHCYKETITDEKEHNLST